MGPSGFVLNAEAYGDDTNVAPRQRALGGETFTERHVPKQWHWRFRVAGAGTKMADAQEIRALRKEIWRQTEQ
eukprot:15109407-Alexandrium_andersonii.AAC.1